MDARETAMLTLNTCQRQGGWSELVLKKQIAAAQLSNRDAALATQLCFGVLQNQMLLDYYLSKFSHISLTRMEGKVVQTLRIAAYQMLFLDRIPHSAAVNSAVAMVKSHCKNPRAAGMVNGILRSLERNMDHLPTIPSTDQTEYYSILYSHPAWYVRFLEELLPPEEVAQLLEKNNRQPGMCVMVNTVKTTVEELEDELSRESVEVRRHPWLENCLLLSRTGNIENLSAFQNGHFYVQDPASRMAVAAAAPKKGARVLDCCAAPGGKSFASAIFMENDGEVISCDIHPHKKKLIHAGAQRLGLDCIIPETADARKFRSQWEEGFDVVLVDAPCSGLGVIRKKPEIRYKDPEPLEELPAIQQEILNNACRYVKPGGVLLYSTCTILPRENENIIRSFLQDHKQFRAEAFHLPAPAADASAGMITLWPHRHDTDGFFICRMRKGE